MRNPFNMTTGESDAMFKSLGMVSFVILFTVGFTFASWIISVIIMWIIGLIAH